MLGWVYSLSLTTSPHMITITNMRPFSIYFPALHQFFNIWNSFFSTSCCDQANYLLLPPSFFFSTYTQIQHTYTKQVRVLFNNTHHSSFFFFFSFPPHLFHSPIFISRAMLRLTSSVPRISFFVVLLSPTSSWSCDLVEGEWDGRGRQAVGMWVGWELVNDCRSSRWTFIWFGRLWNGRPSCIWGCLRWRVS